MHLLMAILVFLSLQFKSTFADLSETEDRSVFNGESLLEEEKPLNGSENLPDIPENRGVFYLPSILANILT
jgi:hypothetical protein